MKRYFLFLLAAILLAAACMKDSVTEHYTLYRPVYWTSTEIKNSIKSGAPTALVQPGKIVVKGHYVFLNEIDKGIHVIDIADAAKPVNLAFIDIPGCVDLAINGNYLYADCYSNLVTIDIADPAHVALKQFLKGVFPIRYYQWFNPDTSMVIKEWIKVDTAVTRGFSGTLTNGLTDNSIIFMSANFPGSQSAIAFSSAGSGIGIAGSLARFALQNNRMYTVATTDLKVFNVTTPDNPFQTSTVLLNQGGIETIFPYK
ncbi:MAG: hypothetical protein JWQ30_303, partial [Sediminibacterium sp.]|nr:hypothetical protein [Sediminibacterium sp.]